MNPIKLAAALVALAGVLPALAGADAQQPNKVLARGKYLIQVGGCNDCHTPGYAESGGSLPESQWLTGSNVGFKGPWGTTYPGNLRIRAEQLSFEQWLGLTRTPLRPPMPSPSLAAMSDADIHAIYLYLRHLGSSGSEAPAALPPGQEPTTPYFDFVPKNL